MAGLTVPLQSHYTRASKDEAERSEGSRVALYEGHCRLSARNTEKSMGSINRSLAWAGEASTIGDCRRAFGGPHSGSAWLQVTPPMETHQYV